MQFRTITAKQYQDFDDPDGLGWDEAFFTDPRTSTRREIWDVTVNTNADGDIGIYTSDAEPIYVDPRYPIDVR